MAFIDKITVDGTDYDIKGIPGAVYTPAVSDAGVISWTNDGDLDNPPDVDIASIAAEAVEGVYVDEVTGSEPTITAEANHRYMCGEVTSLSFTPPASGTAEVYFTSGATPAVVTMPATVKMPEWYTIDVNRIYVISVTDGIYGAVMSWASA